MQWPYIKFPPINLWTTPMTDDNQDIVERINNFLLHLAPHIAQRQQAIYLRMAVDEIIRLRALIEEHNSSLVCDKEKCGYAPYKRDCPTCPKHWMIDIT